MRTLFLLCAFFLISQAADAQRLYFFGFDLGPKMDFYQLNPANNRYNPNLQLKNDVAAMAGITAGVLIDDKFKLETGLYQSNFKTRFTITDDKGEEHFVNEPVNTFSSLMIPVTLNMRMTTTNPRWQFFYGLGFSTFINEQSGIDGFYQSPTSLVDADDPSKGAVQYIIYDNKFVGSLMTANLNAHALYSINDQLFLSLNLEGHYGVSGENFFRIAHKTEQNGEHDIENTVFSKGSAVQFNVGFRYFVDPVPWMK